MEEAAEVTQEEAAQSPEQLSDSEHIEAAAKLLSFDEKPAEAEPEAVATEPETVAAEPEAVADEPAAAAPEAQLSAPKRAKALAALIREQKELKAKNEKLSEAAALKEAERKELEAYRTDPIGQLESKNPDFYSEYTKRKLNDDKPTADEGLRKLREELAELKAANEAMKQEQNQTKEQAIIQKAQADISELVSGDDYELTRAWGAESEVLNLIGMHYQQTGNDLTIKQAADMIEAELEKRLDVLSSAKKFQNRIAATQDKPASKPRSSKAGGASTISKAHSAPASTPVDLSEMDDYDAINMLAKSLDWGV
jgi:hypothetical protein